MNKKDIQKLKRRIHYHKDCIAKYTVVIDTYGLSREAEETVYTAKAEYKIKNHTFAMAYLINQLNSNNQQNENI